MRAAETRVTAECSSKRSNTWTASLPHYARSAIHSRLFDELTGPLRMKIALNLAGDTYAKGGVSAVQALRRENLPDLRVVLLK